MRAAFYNINLEEETSRKSVMYRQFILGNIALVTGVKSSVEAFK